MTAGEFEKYETTQTIWGALSGRFNHRPYQIQRDEVPFVLSTEPVQL